MSIPFFDIKRQYEQIQGEVEEAILETSRSCGYVEGKAVKQLESDLSEYIGVKHVITCNSGTDALIIALQACGVEAGDEVITTAFSFFATAEAIGAVGAVPVFADVKEDDYNIDPSKIEKLITKKTKAILPVHIFGVPADMKAINDIAKMHDIKVLEDACQAIGSSIDGVKAGALGDIAAFSFYPTKNLGAFGDGGMITTNNDQLATICRALKAHGAGKAGYQAALALGKNIGEFAQNTEEATELYDPYKYYNYIIGGNSRLDSIQAAVLDVKLKRLDEFNAKREKIAGKYKNALSSLPIHLPVSSTGKKKNCWHQFVLLTEKKQELIQYMGEKGIGVGAFYPVPLHLQKAFAAQGYKAGDLPIAEKLCEQSVCLPVFPELTEDETDYIIQTIKDFFK